MGRGNGGFQKLAREHPCAKHFIAIEGQRNPAAQIAVLWLHSVPPKALARPLYTDQKPHPV